MQLNRDVAVLALPIVRDGQTQYLNLTLILDPVAGPTLIDAGLPGQLAAIQSALGEVNLQVHDLARIILTHHDIDHVGSLAQLVEDSGARVLAHTIEIPMIDGGATPRFATPEVLAQNPVLRTVAQHFRPTRVDEPVYDGSLLNLAGGLRVIHTPGHTPGHISLYHERTRTLISGDALTSHDGQLHGPNEGATLDMALALESIRKLAEYEPEAIVCYHGGLVREDASGQLRRLAQSSAA
jgi:glyoxylase-like metal-dependent hydrolase (beta-lactamase superfamily II)